MKKAQKIQHQIDDDFNIDVAMFQNTDLRRLRDKISEFLETGVETEELKPAGDYTQEEVAEISKA